jgi:hypothetical protein
MKKIMTKAENFADESPMSRGTQKEMNKAWVIHPWRPPDMVKQLTYNKYNKPLYSDEMIGEY